jgi:hypothetical protein
MLNLAAGRPRFLFDLLAKSKWLLMMKCLPENIDNCHS